MPPDPHCRIGRIKPKGNIAFFPGVTLPDLPAHRQPDADVIDLLQDALREAERGVCQGIAIAWLDDAGLTYSQHAGGGRHPVSLLVGSMTILAQHLGEKANRKCDEDMGK